MKAVVHSIKLAVILMFLALVVFAFLEKATSYMVLIDKNLEQVTLNNFFNLSLIVLMFSIAVYVFTCAIRNFIDATRNTSTSEEEN